MKEAAILQVYIKRRSNLLLLSSEKAFLSAMELWVSVKESLSYIALADRAAYGEYEGDCGIETEAEKYFSCTVLLRKSQKRQCRGSVRFS